MFINKLLKCFLDDESGQGITEYGAVLAFVAVLIAIVIALLAGTLKTAVCQAFSSVASQMTQLASSS